MPLFPLSRRSDELLSLARQLGILRSRDLAASGIAREHLRRLVLAGRLQRIERGLYIVPNAVQTEHHALAEVTKRIPAGVLCLRSALAFHHLMTQDSDEVWLALARDAHHPRVTRWPLQVVRVSGVAWSFGVEVYHVEGVPVQVYSPAKTVADCFKYRSRLGLETALDALRETWRARRATISELWEAAQMCRVTRVMHPYLAMLG